MPERRMIQQSAARVGIEERADGEPHIVGYAAVFYDGLPGTQFEIFTDFIERIMPGAFDRAMSEGDDVRALFNHNVDYVLGRRGAKTMSLSVDDIGLRYDIRPGDTTVGKDVIEHIRREDVTGSSFSFRVTDQDFRTEDGVDIREITGVELFDVGPVTFPAYDATTAGMRSVEDNEATLAYEAWKRKERKRLALAATARVRVLELEEADEDSV